MVKKTKPPLQRKGHSMFARLIAIALLATACSSTRFSAQRAAGSPSPAAIDPATLPALPWHMTNIWWHAAPTPDFSSFSIDVDISCDIPSDTYNLYISPLNGHLNNLQFYGGIQSNCNGWSAKTPSDHTRLHGGHGFIFSRWGSQADLSLNDVRPNPDGLVETAGYEGNFVSGRCPYSWKAGRYTLSILRLDATVIDNKPYTWFGYFVREHQTNKLVFVTALRFPGTSFVHSGQNCAFIEFYSTAKNHQKPDIASLPPLQVTFSNLCFNGSPANLQDIQVRFLRKDEKRKDKLATPISPNILHVTSSSEGQSVTCRLANQIFPDADEPNRCLWKKPVPPKPHP
jgi:hypothetical protein